MRRFLATQLFKDSGDQENLLGARRCLLILINFQPKRLQRAFRYDAFAPGLFNVPLCAVPCQGSGIMYDTKNSACLDFIIICDTNVRNSLCFFVSSCAMLYRIKLFSTLKQPWFAAQTISCVVYIFKWCAYNCRNIHLCSMTWTW